MGTAGSLRYVRKALFVAVVTAAAVLLVVDYGLAAMWHMVVGDTVKFSNFEVPLPRRYGPLTGNPIYFRFSFGAPVIRDQYGLISLASHKPTSGITEERIQSAIIKAAGTDGYRMESKRVIVSPAGMHFCFQFSDAHRAQVTAIRCLSETGELGISFEGNRKFGEDLYAVVAGVRRLQ